MNSGDCGSDCYSAGDCCGDHLTCDMEWNVCVDAKTKIHYNEGDDGVCG